MAELRAAVPEDAAAIAELWLESARAGFGDLLPADHVWPSAAAISERTAAAMGEAGVALVVASGPEGLVGYVDFSASRDPDVVDSVGEIRMMFVHPSAWGGGVGSALLRRAFDELSAAGFAEATVWSFLGNERANAFYEKHGMKRDGARYRDAAWDYIDEVRYRISLG